MDQLYNIFNLLYSRFLLRDFFGKIIPGFIVIFAGAFTLFPPNSWISYISSFSFWFWLLFIGVAWITGFVVQTFGHIIHLVDYEHRREKDKISIKEKMSSIWTKLKKAFEYLRLSSEEKKLREQNKKNKLKYYKKMEQQYKKELEDKLIFNNFASDDEKQQYERTVVIKEATGNGVVALSFCLLLFCLRSFVPQFKYCLEYPVKICRESLIKYCHELLNVNWVFSNYWHIGLILTIIVISGGSLYYMYRTSKTKQDEYLDQVLEHHRKENYYQLKSDYRK